MKKEKKTEETNIDKIVDVRDKIVIALNEIRKNYFYVGLLLCLVKDEKHHKALGYKRVEEYWKEELGIKPAVGWNYTRVAETFVEAYQKSKQFPPFSRLVRALKFCKTDAEAEEWFHKALMLSPVDFDIEIRKHEGKPAPDDCDPHEWELFYRCKKCRIWRKCETEITDVQYS